VKAIEVKNLKKYFGKTRAVDGISFAVQKGRNFWLFGAEWRWQNHDHSVSDGLLKEI